MKSKYEPCSICEKYIEGVICDEYKCPVRKMKEENERLRNYNENLLAANVGLSCDMLDEIKKAKTKAIKEFAEMTDKMITEIYNKHIFGNNDLFDEEKEAIMDFSLDVTSGFDDLVKEMTEGEK